MNHGEDSEHTPRAPVPGVVLDHARAAFEWLCVEPGAIRIDGRSIPGLPDRHLHLGEVRARLEAPRCPLRLRDAVWAEVIGRARRGSGGTWTVACVGLVGLC